MAGEIEGMQAFNANLARVTDEVVERVADAVERTAIRISNHAKAGHQKGQGHAAGRYENQTGVLTNSINAQLTKKTKDEVIATVSTIPDYAPLVEFGTRRATARPFMLPAADSQREQFPKQVEAAIRGNA